MFSASMIGAAVGCLRVGVSAGEVISRTFGGCMGELNLELTGPRGMSPGVGGMLVRANAAATAAAVVVP